MSVRQMNVSVYALQCDLMSDPVHYHFLTQVLQRYSQIRREPAQDRLEFHANKSANFVSLVSVFKGFVFIGS